MTGSSEGRGISRRTIVKGAAWSVPVIAVGPSLPAMAATAPVLEFGGTACKIPGQGQDINKGYVLGFTINNGNDFDIRIEVTNFTIIGATGIEPLGIQLENCDVIPYPLPPSPEVCWPKGETRIALYLQENGNSQNATLVLDYVVYECGTDRVLQQETRLEVTLSGDPITRGCEPFDGWYDTCSLPDPPTITSVSPTAAEVGERVAVNGSNLGSAQFPEFTTIDLVVGTTRYPQPVRYPSSSANVVQFDVAVGTPPGTYDLVLDTGVGTAVFNGFEVLPPSP